MRARWALVVVAAVIPFLNSLGNDFVLDDTAIVRDNPLIRDLRGLPRLFRESYWAPHDQLNLYRPLTIASYAVNRAITGPAASGFRAGNMLLHVIASLLVLQLVRWLGGGDAGALVSSLLFAVHPLHVEAVTGLVGRAEILAAIGAMLALGCHVAAGSRRPLWIAGAAVGLAIGLLAKEVAAGCLVGLALYDLARWRAGARPRLAPWVVYAVIVFAYAGARVAVLGLENVASPPRLSLLDNPLVEEGALARPLVAAAVLARYLLGMVWPAVLSADYSYAQIPMTTSPLRLDTAVGLAAALSVVLAAAAAVWRGRHGVAAALGLFLGSYFVISNAAVLIGTIMAERLFYLPSAGLAIALGLVIPARLPSRAWVIVGSLTLVLAVRTWTRNLDWRDELTLFAKTAETSPRSVRAHVYHGQALEKDGQHEAALLAMERAMAIDREMAWTWNSLAQVYGQGDVGRAVQALERAIELEPRLADAHSNLGATYVWLGEYERGIAELELALGLRPHYHKAELALVEAHLGRGRLDDAQAHLAPLLRRRAELPAVQLAHAHYLEASGDVAGATTAFERALAADRNAAAAAIGLARLREQARDLDGALARYEQARSTDDPPLSAFVRPADLLSTSGRLAEAQALLVEARGRLGVTAELEAAFAIVAMRGGDLAAARAAFRRGLELDPGMAESYAAVATELGLRGE